MGDSRCGDPPFCERQLETLRARRKRVEEMERDRDAVLEHYATLASEALDSLTSEEHHQLYKMHKLKVFAAKSGDLTIEFAGVPTESVGPNSSSTAEVISRFARTGARW